MHTARLDRIEKQLRVLRLYSFSVTTLLLVLGLSAFRSGNRTQLDQLDVKRINVVEEDGTTRLVISNLARSPGGMIDGQQISRPGQRAGMIFYNDEGDENGGLIFSGRRDSTGRISSYVSLTLDRHEQDQVVALQYREIGGRQQQGLTVLDRPDVSLARVLQRQREINSMPGGPAKDSAWKELAAMQGGVSFGAPRLFVGRDAEKAAVLELKDKRGRSKLRLLVDSLGAAKILFLDDSGRVRQQFPNPQ